MSRSAARAAAILSPWRDRTGRFSVLKAATFLALFVPGLANALEYALGLLGPRPIAALIQAMGLWAIRLLFASLAITPARQVLRAPQLVSVRRMIGLAAFAYASIHLFAFAADKMFDLAAVASEIVLRVYLAIGAVGLILLCALAAISTDGMIRRLGAPRWQALQRGIYAIALLATIHFFMQSKIDATEPTVMAGLLLWLLGYRALLWYGGTRLVTARLSLIGLSFAAGLITAFGEAAYFGLFTRVDPMLVLQADMSLAAGFRPAWIVLAIALTAVACAFARDLGATFVTRRDGSSPH